MSSKLNVCCIIVDHFSTLRSEDEENLSLIDLLTFLFVPFLISLSAAYFEVTVDEGAYSIVISIFAVFAALLFSAQVAVYSLSVKSIEPSDDKILVKIRTDRAKEFRRLLGQINKNISYLILLSCLGLCLLLLFFVVDFGKQIESLIVLFLFVHFFLTLLMVIKRMHSAFLVSYEDQ